MSRLILLAPRGDMYPILFHIGSWPVLSSWFFLVLGVLAGGLVGGREARRLGHSQRRILSFCLTVFPGALLLGAINGLLFDPVFYRALADGQLLLFRGLASYGVIFGALLLGTLFDRLGKRPPGQGLDLIVLVLPLMLSIYRAGCLLQGCCYGRVTDGFGGVYLPGDWGDWACRYPTQVLLIALDVALFLWLWARRKHKPYEGSQVLPFLFWFALGRLAIDSLRDLPILVLDLNLRQLTDILILVVTAVLLVKRRGVPQPVSSPDPLDG